MKIKLCFRFMIWLTLFFVVTSFTPGLAKPIPDGIKIIVNASQEKEPKVQYLSLILRTGFASDPPGKAGLTALTNNLLYYNFLYGSDALQVNYQTAADYSRFNFWVADSDWDHFVDQLDHIIRLDALLYFDLCNEILLGYQNEARPPSQIALTKFLELAYGSSHPYYIIRTADFKGLSITDVNNWFRQIYRLNNLIIATSAPLKESFLQNPTGRDFKTAVKFEEIPPGNGNPKALLNFNPVHDNIASILMGFTAPSIPDSDFFTALLTQKYLEKELWNLLREENGFCYDLQVYYPYFEYGFAPFLLISFQTLPEESGTAIQQVFDLLAKLAEKGIAQTRLSDLINKELRLIELRNAQLETSTYFLGFQALYPAWPENSTAYLSKLKQVTSKNIADFIGGKLKSLKVIVAGPAETEKYLKEIPVRLGE